MPATLFDYGEDGSSNQIGGNDKPANRWNLQKVIDYTMTGIEQAEITGHDGKNACHAKADKPGDSEFFKGLFHILLHH